MELAPLYVHKWTHSLFPFSSFFFCSSPHEDTKKMTSGHEGEALTRTWHAGKLILEFPTSKTMESKCLLLKPTRLWCPITASWADLDITLFIRWENWLQKDFSMFASFMREQKRNRSIKKRVSKFEQDFQKRTWHIADAFFPKWKMAAKKLTKQCYAAR